MKKIIFEHPILTGFVVFLLVIIGGSISGMIAGILVITSDTSRPLSPNDPHDGAAMAAGMIFSLLVTASSVLSVFAGLSTILTLKLLLRRKLPAENLCRDERIVGSIQEN